MESNENVTLGNRVFYCSAWQLTAKSGVNTKNAQRGIKHDPLPHLPLPLPQPDTGNARSMLKARVDARMVEGVVGDGVRMREKEGGGGMTNRDGMACEHCLIGGTILSMYGRVRVFECELGYRNSDRDCCIGFFEICDYYPKCFTSRSTWPIKKDRPAKFKYKRIPRSEMRKSPECLEEEKEDENRRNKEREQLRNKAFELLKQAEAIK